MFEKLEFRSKENDIIVLYLYNRRKGFHVTFVGFGGTVWPPLLIDADFDNAILAREAFVENALMLREAGYAETLPHERSQFPL